VNSDKTQVKVFIAVRSDTSTGEIEQRNIKTMLKHVRALGDNHTIVDNIETADLVIFTELSEIGLMTEDKIYASICTPIEYALGDIAELPENYVEISKAGWKLFEGFARTLDITREKIRMKSAAPQQATVRSANPRLE